MVIAKRWWAVPAVIAAVAVVIALGGFNRRSDVFTATAPGAEIDSVNLIYTFSKATAQKVVSDYSDPYWEVVAIGTVSNPNDEAVAPLLGDYGQFALKDPASAQVAVPTWGSVEIGGDELRTQVVPGMEPASITIRVEMEGSFSPGADIVLAVAPAEYTDNVVLGLGRGRKNWSKDSLAPMNLLHLPLDTLPERKA